MSDYLTEFAEGAAERLAAAGVGVWQDAAAASGQTLISLRAIPQAPDHVIALTPYVVSDDPAVCDSVVGLRVDCRGDTDPGSAQGLDSAVFGVLEGLAEVLFGEVWVVLLWRQSGLPHPRDDNQRWEVSSTYYARVAWPEQNPNV